MRPFYQLAIIGAASVLLSAGCSPETASQSKTTVEEMIAAVKKAGYGAGVRQ
jgi:hypothetical protein